MGWNEPDKSKDPWGGKSQPPDLDEALKRLQSKLKKVFMRGPGKPDDILPSGSTSGGGLLALMIGLITFILWALSGLFIVDPAEQAAILRFGKYV